jgi:alkaline phosphatase D
MIGHVTDKSARLWMQFPVAGDVTINAFEIERNIEVSGLRVGLEGPTPFVCDVPVSGLQPNKNYRVEVKFDGQAVKIPELAIRTAPIPGEETTFTIAFGGGVDIEPLSNGNGGATQMAPVFKPHKMPLFRTIEDAKPRTFFFLGEIGRLPAKLEDYPTTHRNAYRFLADFQSLMRREPDFQGLFRNMACYGIYGDRDFGPAASPVGATPAATRATGTAAAVGGGGEPEPGYVFTQESLVAFERFWPNADWGTPENPGCYSKCSFGDVDFLLLDGRTFRDRNAMLGKAQLAWLEKNLKASRATFKILGTAYPLFAEGQDGWAKYASERDAFLKWLGENQINGIVAMVGGQPTAGITKFQAPGVKYPLLTASAGKLFAPDSDPKNQNFGTLDFGGLREHRFVTLQIRDAAGKVKTEQTLMAVNLRD